MQTNDLVGAPHRCLIDGRCEDRIPLSDRGLQYGDGLFETMRIRFGQPCQLKRHLDRLVLGAGRLGLILPASLAEESRAVARDLDDGILKLIVTRGRGGRGYRPPATPMPTRILLTYPNPSPLDRNWKQGIAVRYCRTPASMNPALAGIKHLNRLDCVLARQEWTSPEIEEGLMLDHSGAIVGGTMTNLFLWDGTRLRTPSVAHSGIAGTVRALTMELAGRLAVKCHETRIEPADIERAAGVFLTNAIVGVWPVREVAHTSFDQQRLPWELITSVYRAAQTPGSS